MQREGERKLQDEMNKISKHDSHLIGERLSQLTCPCHICNSCCCIRFQSASFDQTGSSMSKGSVLGRRGGGKIYLCRTVSRSDGSLDLGGPWKYLSRHSVHQALLISSSPQVTRKHLICKHHPATMSTLVGVQYMSHIHLAMQ